MYREEYDDVASPSHRLDEGLKHSNLLKFALSKARLSGLTLKHFCLCLIGYFSRRVSAATQSQFLSGSRNSRAVGALVFVTLHIAIRRTVHSTFLYWAIIIITVTTTQTLQTFPLPFPSVSNLSRWVPPYLNNKNIIF